jgi:hypothetical protein
MCPRSILRLASDPIAEQSAAVSDEEVAADVAAARAELGD